MPMLLVRVILCVNNNISIDEFSPQPKKRRPNKKIRQVLRETVQDKAKQEEKAKREEKEKKEAEVAAKKENKKLEKRNKKTKV